MRRTLLSITLLTTLSAGAFAQADRMTRDRDDDPQLTDRTELISRTVKAVNYRHRGETKIDMRGTDQMPNALGVAEIKSRQGRLNIDLSIEHFGKMPWDFGPEFLTYVLWAITPDGRPQNLGEILNVDHTHFKQNATTTLQDFALIITAEPDFAVTQPSEVVVMENVVRPDTMGSVDVVDARYSLLRSGSYTEHVEKGELKPLLSGERHVPLELLEARNAVRIAGWAQADRYAAENFRNAQDQLNKAQADQDARNDKNVVIAEARQAVQTAEDARLLALKRKHEEQARNAQREADEQAAEAQAQAQQESAQRQLAEQQAQTAQQQAQDAQQQAEQARQQAADLQRQAQQEREEAEAAKQQALADRQQAGQQLAQAQQQAQTAQQQAQSAQQQATAAQQRETDLRQRLQVQLNQVLQTRDSAKGLIVNMSDVLFDVNQSTLKPGAREKLAKVAGILLAYPDLRIRVDGYTDSTGTADHNRDLSQRRADTVRGYLLKQGISADAVISEGYGQENPVATNGMAAGRQQNRRVEMVVSGQSIGSTNPADTSATAH
jgi:outer membrane protein OmpA-like peptidoglycan-associated protein